MNLFWVSFLTILDIYKAYFRSRQTWIQRPRDYFFSVRSYLYVIGFCNQVLLALFFDEVKNFVANNICSSCWSQSCTGIYSNGQSQIGYLCIKGKKATTRSSPIEYWSESSTVSWYFGIAQGRGKIPYSCNRLIVDQCILGSGNLKITRWGFCLKKDFPHLSTNHYVKFVFLLHLV